MIIHPPKIKIDDQEPFKDALFGRKEFAKSITAILRNVTESIVLFVNAPWGEGKTTFAQMWRAELRNQKLDVIYFDAYAADYIEEPFISFSGEILELVNKRLSKEKGLTTSRQKFKKTVVEAGKHLGVLSVKLGIKAITMGILDAADLSHAKDVEAGAADDLSQLSAEIIEKKLDNHTAEKDALNAFRKSLAELAAMVRKEQGFPLTIIVDELDRCRPSFALGLLERIKHLFDVDGVAFLLLVNREQIEGYIRAVYGEAVNAHAYLMKFANLFVDLPHRQPMFEHEKGRKEYCQLLMRHHNFSEAIPNGGFFARNFDPLVEHFELTLRELEKVFVIFTLYYSSLPQRQFSNEFLISLLGILKVKHPDIYRKLRLGKITDAEFFQETGLRNFGHPSNLATDMLSFCLSSEIEFERVSKDPASGVPGMNQMLAGVSIERTKVIPYLCSRLDRFSVQP